MLLAETAALHRTPSGPAKINLLQCALTAAGI